MGAAGLRELQLRNGLVRAAVRASCSLVQGCRGEREVRRIAHEVITLGASGRILNLGLGVLPGTDRGAIAAWST